MGREGIGIPIGKYKYDGDVGDVNASNDYPITIKQMSDDVHKEWSTKRRATQQHGLGITGFVILAGHTLERTTDHAHHLVVTDSPGRTVNELIVVTHTGVCRICGGVDTWTTGECLTYWNNRDVRKSNVE